MEGSLSLLFLPRRQVGIPLPALKPFELPMRLVTSAHSQQRSRGHLVSFALSHPSANKEDKKIDGSGPTSADAGLF